MNNNFKGTKGKWANNDGNIVDENNIEIVDIITLSKEDEANALLISKAPEILKELVNEVEILKAMGLGDTERCKRKEQLIKEATEL